MPKTYTTVQGDMWDSVAFKVMGSERYMSQLIQANTAHMRIFIFPADVVLIIPDKADIPLESVPPWKRGGVMYD